jgi:hypothetical protein
MSVVMETMRRHGAAPARPLPPARLFVLTRAVTGAIRAAVLEESPLLGSPEFEDELVRLVLGGLRAGSAEMASPRP